MAFKDDLTSDLQIFFNLEEFAAEVVYISQEPPQTQVNIKALVDYGGDLDEFGPQKADKAILQILRSEAPDITPGDAFAIDGLQYNAYRVTGQDEHTITVHLQRDARAAI